MVSMDSPVPRKIFKFENRENATRTLSMSFQPEIVIVQQVTHDGLETYPWATLTLADREVSITLPAGEYRVVVYGLEPDIDRWETDGGHDDA